MHSSYLPTYTPPTHQNEQSFWKLNYMPDNINKSKQTYIDKTDFMLNFGFLVNSFLITQYVIVIAFIVKEYKSLITFFSGSK